MSDRIRIRCPRRVTDQFKCAVCRLRKIHREAAVSDVASELLAKQQLNIGGSVAVREVDVINQPSSPKHGHPV